ncbi:IS3 family transposase, partial [Aeribacillus composti]|uniref:IS3 family transposase n=1 Tax=Aeribacillus composti TaxID=1868734 RepID=UPI003D24ABA7
GIILRLQYKGQYVQERKLFGHCLQENFFSHFKAECFHLYSFHKAEEVKDAVHKYIRFYNHQRFQKKLNNLSPYEYRTQAA